MKFRFCGEADCPDWLLMQINTLTKLNPSQLQVLCEVVVQPLLGKEMDYAKLRNFSKEASLENSETKACVSAITQILRSGSSYAVSPTDLGQELEQLGLDRLHSQTIVKVYSREREEIMLRLKESIIKYGRLDKVSAEVAGSSSITLDLSHTDFVGKSQHNLVKLSIDQARLLLADLKSIRSRMEELHGE